MRNRQRDALAHILPQLEIRLPEDGGPIAPARLFPSHMDAVWLEIGFGAGEHLLWQATRAPRIGVIGCDFYLNGLARLAARMQAGGPDNIRIHQGNALDLLDHLAPASLDRIFLLFPDPWPKRRHARRRFIQRASLDMLAHILAPGGELRIATDDPALLRWTLRHMRERPDFAWQARHAPDWQIRPPDWPETRYEAKARARGSEIFYLRYRLCNNMC